MPRASRLGTHFDVAVCDLMMPDMSGQALQERVASRWPTLARKFIFLTGGAFTQSARSFLEHTACASMEKPFLPDELLGLVEQVGAQPP